MHPGGPFWANKDEGAWSIPKGLVEDNEDSYQAARREFAEERGSEAPDSAPLDPGEIRLKSGKKVVDWALQGDFDPATLASNEFEMEWPPRSRAIAQFPEVDRVAGLPSDVAKVKLNPAQATFVDRFIVSIP